MKQNFPAGKIYFTFVWCMILATVGGWLLDTPVGDRWILTYMMVWTGVFTHLVHIFWEKLDAIHRDSLDEKVRASE